MLPRYLLNMMHECKQEKKRYYSRANRLQSCMGQRCNRPLLMLIFLIIFLYSAIHVTQTTRFLLEHFFRTEDVNDLIRLDMKIWQQMQNDEISRRKIPRYIHQIWIASEKHKEMNDNFRKAADACIKLHTDYNYTLWTHAKIIIWLQREYAWFLPLYRSYRYDMQRVDAMKYLLLFHFGGVYIDLDIQCKVGDIITAMLTKNQTTNEPNIIFHMGGEGIAANTDIMAAKQYHPFFKLAVNRLKSANRFFYLYHLTIILSAGPTYLYGIYRKYPFKDNIYFIPNELLWKKSIDGVGGETWYGNDTLLLIFLVKHRLFLCLSLPVLCFILFYVFRIWKKTHH